LEVLYSFTLLDLWEIWCIRSCDWNWDGIDWVQTKDLEQREIGALAKGKVNLEYKEMSEFCRLREKVENERMSNYIRSKRW
jgi:hypothetical protein